MIGQQQLAQSARRLAHKLVENGRRIVFAESCTGGLVSATLAAIPGISHHLCGSAVVYRIDTKARWLGVDRTLLEKPGPVSRVVAAAMAEGVLQRTPEADCAAAVTGHLGPEAPPRQDGLVFVGLAERRTTGRRSRIAVRVRRFHLPELLGPADQTTPKRRRRRRQFAAAWLVLDSADRMLGD